MQSCLLYQSPTVSLMGFLVPWESVQCMPDVDNRSESQTTPTDVPCYYIYTEQRSCARTNEAVYDNGYSYVWRQ